MIDIRYVPCVAGAPMPLARWQIRALEKFQDHTEEEDCANGKCDCVDH